MKPKPKEIHRVMTKKQFIRFLQKWLANYGCGPRRT